MRSNKRQTVVITGAAGGIGEATAMQLAAKGNINLVLVDHPKAVEHAEALKERIQQMGETARLNVCVKLVDVTDYTAVQLAAYEIIAAFQRVDVLVNAAGILSKRLQPFVKTSVDDMREVMDVNYWGTVHWCKTVLPQMQVAGYGRIINISSVVAQKGDAGNVGYAASKGAISQLTKTLAIEAPFDKEHRDTGALDITVNAVCPGITETGMTKNLPEASLAAYMMRNPLHRKILAQEVAAAIVFLASKQASAINGIELAVDGGYLISS